MIETQIVKIGKTTYLKTTPREQIVTLSRPIVREEDSSLIKNKKKFNLPKFFQALLHI